MTVTMLPGSGKTETAITYLSGAIRTEALDWRTPGLGILVTPLMGNVPTQPGLHAHDNGVWSEFTSKGKKPFQLDAFLRHLDLWRGAQSWCLFAVAPDVVGDWRATLERSAPVLPEIRKRGYRAALVAQNDLEDHMDEIPWDTFDVLFLGGGPRPEYLSKTNRVSVKTCSCAKRCKHKRTPMGEWKLTPGAARLVAEARRRGKDVHMGRVNSLLRLSYAQTIGCTSADGTIIAFGPDIRTPEVQGWLQTLNPAKPQAKASCFLCRWHAQAYVNTYSWMTVDHVLANVFKGSCPHAQDANPQLAPYRGAEQLAAAA